MNSINNDTDFNNVPNRTYSSTLNRCSTNNPKQKTNYTLNLSHVSSTDDFGNCQMARNQMQMSNDIPSNKTSNYSNFKTNIKMDLDRDKTRRSRPLEICDKGYIYSSKDQVKRDLSMPPTNCREQMQIDEIFCSKYKYGFSKLSIGDLDEPNKIIDSGISNIYDSVLTNDSITPPPVNMIHEYANRKAIIRPLAFRPLAMDPAQTSTDTSPVTTPAFTSDRVGFVRRGSPPPIPPHSSRISRKSSLGRVPSLQSGDSSGYYSSRTVCTTNGNTSSSTDMSPTLDDNCSLLDSAIPGEIYANTMDLIRFHEHPIDDQDNYVAQTTLDSELTDNKEQCRILETALSNSNSKLLNAETKIAELKMRLSQRTMEANEMKENLALVKRSLEHQTQKSYNLEKSVLTLQSMKFEKSKEKMVKDKMTQANFSTEDCGPSRLFEQFEDERRTWLDEKLKVLTYQRQIEINFQKLLIKYRHLGSQLTQLKGHAKECRTQHSNSANPIDDVDKSSLNSTDSSGRNHFTNITRIESTEHQLSF